MNKNINFTWLDVQEAAYNCLKKIKDTSSIKAVVALGRGGAIPAAYLAYQLDIPLEYIHYSRQRGLQDATIRRYEPDSCFLLVDDATETGGTFETIKKTFHEYHFITCALFQSEKSNYFPDVYGCQYEPVKPILPWEKNNSL